MRDELDSVDVSFAAFRQRFSNGPQRRRLGYELTQEDAVRILNDPKLLTKEYETWRATDGRTPREGATVNPRGISRFLVFVQRDRSTAD